jgi:hypothetical protein
VSKNDQKKTKMAKNEKTGFDQKVKKQVLTKK